MTQDRYGLPLSTSSAAAGAYVEGVDRFLAAQAAAEECFDRAVAADPGFALAHIGRARCLQLQGRGALAQAAA
ncbi:MAG: tetratricopeptide repeat protein, partial [Candidatus Rokuibacteriota bacterium]